MPRSSSGSTPYSSASSHQRSIIRCNRSGSAAARSWHSERSTSTWYSSHWSSSKGWPWMWRVTAFQPSSQSPRWPTISKYWIGFALGASGAAVQLDTIDVPETGICS